jgi:hypothetical protein
MGKIFGKAPIHETIPPHQEKFEHGTDDWNLKTPALPTGSPHIHTQPGNAGVLARENDRNGNPMYDSDNSRFIHPSMTDGKKKD